MWRGEEGKKELGLEGKEEGREDMSRDVFAMLVYKQSMFVFFCFL